MKILDFTDFILSDLTALPKIEDVYACIVRAPKTDSTAIKDNILLKIAENENKSLLDLSIVLGPHGKPEIKGSNFKFNLSHTNGLIAIIISPNQNVGIDIESWRKKEKLLPISNRYYHPNEIKSLNLLSSDEDWEKQALKFWTHKEALVKSRGATIFQGLEKVDTQSDKNWSYHFDKINEFSVTMVKS